MAVDSPEQAKMMESPRKITIEAPSSRADLDETRALFAEYARALGVDLGFQDFDGEMAVFPQIYRAMFLARVDGEAAGAVAFKAFSGAAGDCEMKRLYCRPDFRREGLGRTLAEAVIAEARALGFRRMLLDSLAPMRAAQALYRDLGFREVAPYYDNPLDGVVYMARDL